MVYEKKTASVHDHVLIPIEDYPADRLPLELPQTVERKLKKTGNDISSHLKSSVRQTEEMIRTSRSGRSAAAVY